MSDWMKRVRRTALVLVILTAAPGCLPDGPYEMYRTELQARTEYVDSLSRVVDDETAKTIGKTAGDVYQERRNEVRDALQKIKFENSFRALQRDNFQPTKIDAGDRATMTAGIGAYAQYRQSVITTDARLAREMQRLNRLDAMLRLKKMDSSGVQELIRGWAGPDYDKRQAMANAAKEGRFYQPPDDLAYVPDGITVEHLVKFGSGLSPEVLQLATRAGNVGVPLKTPDLGPYPEWATEIMRREQVSYDYITEYLAKRKQDDQNKK